MSTIESKLAGLPTIAKRQLVDIDGAATQHYGLFARYADGAQECLSTTFKAGYQLPALPDLSAMTWAAVKAFGNGGDIDHRYVVRAGWFNEAWNVIIGPSNEQRISLIETGEGSNLWQRTRIKMPFNGRMIEIASGLYCDLCTNLAEIQTKESAVVRIGHYSDMQNNLDELIHQMETSQRRGESMIEAARKYDTVQTSISDYIGQWYRDTIGLPESDSGSAYTRFTNIVDAIRDRLRIEADKTNRDSTLRDDTATVWQVANAITGWVQHDATRRKIGGNAANRVQRALAGVDDTKSKVCWSMAAELAA